MARWWLHAGGSSHCVQVRAASELCDRWSKKVVHCGPVGAGDATKCINNVLNSAHLLLATEGMLALKSYGVDPATALEAINGGSGMSLQTTRLPDNVLSRKFAYGFALGLMHKDCRIAGSLVESQTPSATLIPRVVELLAQALEAGLQRSAELGVSGVPAFFIDGTALGAGALPAATLRQALADECAASS